MGPFGIPWNITIIYISGFIVVPVIAQILLSSKWWKKQSDFYYSFNKNLDEKNKNK